MKQRSEEWFASRWGKFTGSQISKLMGSGKKKDEVFSATAYAYIKEKVAEILTEGKSQENKKVDTWATRWGNDYEPIARKMYEGFASLMVDECGFILHNDHFGASPDGLIGTDGVLEIKCPYTSEKHVDYLLCVTAEDLFKTCPEYYYQMQAEMICTKRDWCDFVSYDPRCQPRSCLKVIRVEKNEAICEEILLRVKLATEILEDMLLKINYF